MRFFSVILLTLFLSTSYLGLYSQVGMGTTSPDPSSMLDITSTTQGMLTPRMTGAQRLLIASPGTPPEGLLVFDTDQNAFYFYNGSQWVELDKRNNYKLIKSNLDLAEELTAGGGTEYLMQGNTLYEINGTIDLAVPININGSHIFGQDTGEDVLRSLGGTIFAGSTGGNVRRVALRAPGGTLFNVSGTGAENFILRDCNAAGISSLGTLSNLNLVYLTDTLFISNTDGFTFTDVGDLLFTNLGWDGSNGGTYMTFTGDFKNIQNQGGYIEVIGATAGIDITGITSITGGAGLRIIQFLGGGNYINGTATYLGYDFTNDWDVNCPGIPVETDGVASGNFYYNGDLTTGFTQTITSGAPVEVQGGGTFVTNSLFRFISAGGGNRLTYDGIKPREFKVNASLSIRVNGATGNFYAFVLAKNGVLVTESNSVVFIDNATQIQNISINANVGLDNGDYIEVFTQRLSGTGSDVLSVFSENLSIK